MVVLINEVNSRWRLKYDSKGYENMLSNVHLKRERECLIWGLANRAVTEVNETQQLSLAEPFSNPFRVVFLSLLLFFLPLCCIFLAPMRRSNNCFFLFELTPHDAHGHGSYVCVYHWTRNQAVTRLCIKQSRTIMSLRWRHV